MTAPHPGAQTATASTVRPGDVAPEVCTAYAEEIDARRRLLERTSRHPGSDHTGAPEALQGRLEERITAHHEQMVSLMEDLHAHPEVAFEEHRSAEAIAGVLREHGLQADVGVHGLDTAIRSEIRGAGGADAPTVAVLSEYDALPAIGHGCGHNIIAVMGLGAYLALADLARTDPEAVPGRIVFLGTPAEEGHTGKEYMARHGAFDDIDAAMMVHPYDNDCADQLWLGRSTLTARFHGRPAHASAQPFMGRNALDAASLMYQGIGLMRQQIPPSDRVHAIIPEGGHRASIIPDESRLDMYVRSAAPATLRDLSRRVEDIARGAALMTGCSVDVTWDHHPPSLPVRTNEVLTGRWVEAQRRRGREPLPRGVVSETLAASTDFGNVSHLVPGIHPVISTAPVGTALHTREFAATTITDQARAAAADGAFGLAATALDVMHDPELLRAARAEFEDAGGVVRAEGYFD